MRQEESRAAARVKESRASARVMERVRSRQERHRQRNRLVRVAFAIAGFVVLVLGVIMLFTPGPGWAAIILGLGILALEFSWAERWLERVVEQAERAADQVTKGSPARRMALLAVGVLATLALVAMVLIWDIPFFPG